MSDEHKKGHSEFPCIECGAESMGHCGKVGCAAMRTQIDEKNAEIDRLTNALSEVQLRLEAAGIVALPDDLPGAVSALVDLRDTFASKLSEVLAANRRILKIADKRACEVVELRADAEELKRFIEALPCPNPQCSDGSVQSTGPDPIDEPCEWCMNRHFLLGRENRVPSVGNDTAGDGSAPIPGTSTGAERLESISAETQDSHTVNQQPAPTNSPLQTGGVWLSRSEGAEWEPWGGKANPPPPTADEVSKLAPYSGNGGHVVWRGVHFHAIRFGDGNSERVWDAVNGWRKPPLRQGPSQDAFNSLSRAHGEMFKIACELFQMQKNGEQLAERGLVEYERLIYGPGRPVQPHATGPASFTEPHSPRTCREVPPGNGYCVECANGHPERCLYVVPRPLHGVGTER